MEQGKGKKQSQKEESSSSSSSSEEKSQKSKSSGSKGKSESKDASKSDDGGVGKYGKDGPQPKILNENPPGEHDESVRQHNYEMEHRAERASMGASNEDAKKDKVGGKFWSGK